MTDLPTRLLLGSGPSPVPQRVLDALAHPTIGHLDPAFAAVMDETSAMLREVFATANEVTFPVSGTGSAGMEAMVANLVRPGDRVVCGVHGVFGGRMADELERHGADVVRVEAEWGRAIATERLLAEIARGCAACFVVHAETSTGVRQPLEDLGAACREVDALLLVDCVTSLSGVPVGVDEHLVDAAFSGTQKCLNCPPGLAPLTVGERALERVPERGPSWYFDLGLVLGYWRSPDGEGAARVYHHTAPTNLVVALREALALALEEGLDARYARHTAASAALLAGLEALGFARVAPPEEALDTLLCLRVPEGLEDEGGARRALLLEHDIEVSGGLGPLAGKVWRVGVMGEGARPAPQRRLLEAAAAVLDRPADEALAAHAAAAAG